MFKVHEKGAQGGPGEQARGSNEEAVSSEVESERLKLASQVMNSIKNKLRIFDESDILSDNKVEKREVGYVKKAQKCKKNVGVQTTLATRYGGRLGQHGALFWQK